MLGALASDLPAMSSHHVPSPPPDPGFPPSTPLPGLTRLAGIRARLRAAPRLAWAALCRRYPYHGIDTLLVVTGAVYYALHPGDASHALMQHFGVGDDLLVLGIAARWVNSDLEDFLVWEQTGGHTDRPPP